MNKQKQKMSKKREGISLIVLSITIIVIVILAVSLILTLTKNNPILNAKKAVILNDVSLIREAIVIKNANQKIVGDNNKLFGKIVDILGEEYQKLDEKYAIEANRVVYKDGKFSTDEEKILKENDVEKESKYYLIVNERTKTKEYAEKEEVITLRELQEKITSKEFVKEKFNKAYLIEDIDIGAKWGEDKTLIEGESWKPISAIPKGTILDGDGYKIEGIYINSTEANKALINVNNGVIQNIKLDSNCYIKSIEDNTGGICVSNQNGASIINCINNADVEGGRWNTGGICSNSNGVIKRCINNGQIKGQYIVAGIAGYANSSNVIEECINNGNISSENYKVAGILGGGGIHSFGGDFGIVKRCINYGKISAGNTAAGIVERGCGIVEECINTGDISAYYSAGGIMATLNEGGMITNCYNTANAKWDTYGGVGGIVVKNAGKIKNSYNIGECFKR